MPADASATQAIQPWTACPLHRRVTCAFSGSRTLPTTSTPCSERFLIRMGTRTSSPSRKPASKTLARGDLRSSAGLFFTWGLCSAAGYFKFRISQKVLINCTLTKVRTPLSVALARESWANRYSGSNVHDGWKTDFFSVELKCVRGQSSTRPPVFEGPGSIASSRPRFVRLRACPGSGLGCGRKQPRHQRRSSAPPL